MTLMVFNIKVPAVERISKNDSPSSRSTIWSLRNLNDGAESATASLLLSGYSLRNIPFGFHLRHLGADLPRVDDELERIEFLVFLHELQVGQPRNIIHGLAS
jgi:hypothetical protein